ncbi:MAG: hypothetical protein HON78_04140 [Legionellales bacterium]|nr:hypothetical protein [Legionellales bacterium]
MNNLKVITLASIPSIAYIIYIAVVGAVIAPTILLYLSLLNLLTTLVVKLFLMSGRDYNISFKELLFDLTSTVTLAIILTLPIYYPFVVASIPAVITSYIIYNKYAIHAIIATLTTIDIMVKSYNITTINTHNTNHPTGKKYGHNNEELDSKSNPSVARSLDPNDLASSSSSIESTTAEDSTNGSIRLDLHGLMSSNSSNKSTTAKDSKNRSISLNQNDLMSSGSSRESTKDHTKKADLLEQINETAEQDSNGSTILHYELYLYSSDGSSTVPLDETLTDDEDSSNEEGLTPLKKDHEAYCDNLREQLSKVPGGYGNSDVQTNNSDSVSFHTCASMGLGTKQRDYVSTGTDSINGVYNASPNSAII